MRGGKALGGICGGHDGGRGGGGACRTRANAGSTRGATHNTTTCPKAQQRKMIALVLLCRIGLSILSRDGL